MRTAEDARRLALLLNSTTRRAPVVVISTAAGERDPYADAAEVASTLGELAEVHVIPTGDVSWEFSSAMPPMTQVYGGASRVYPVDLEWTSSPTRSPLRFAYGARDRDRVTDLLISDAMGMALAAGLVRVPSRQAMVHAAGEVMGVVGSRAMVKTDRGVVTIWPELTVADVDADRLFAKGMHVAGHLDMAHRRLDVRGSLVPVDQLLTAYPPGATVLGRVARLDAGGCHVELVPGVRAFVKAGDASADDRTPLTSLMTVGETVTVRILASGDANGKGWRLTLVDVDPGVEPTAAALLDGAPPWLTVPPLEQETVQEDPEPAPVVPIVIGPASELLDVPPMVVSPSEVVGLRAERDGFLTELEAARARIDKLERSREQLRRQAREAVNDADRRRRQVQSLHEELARAAHDSTLFLEPADQLDFEVRLAWARRTPASEKSELTLQTYEVGKHFFESWDAVDGIDRQKVVDVLVEVLTGRVHGIAGRETHQLRTSEGGGSPFVSRPDGATCWRVALQVNTPQARRLHYWMRTDGSVELSSVRQHDDVRP